MSKKKMAIIMVAAIVAAVGIGVGVFLGTKNLRAYSAAEKSFSAGEYKAAVEEFTALGDYRDSQSMAMKANYELAKQRMEEKDFDSAIEVLEGLGDYEDTVDLTKECQYQQALYTYNGGDLDGAIAILLELPELDTAVKQLRVYQYEKAQNLFEQEAYVDAEALFVELDDYEDSKEFAMKSAYLQTVDGQFLKCLKEGLEARWDFQDSEDGAILPDSEHREKAISIEQEKLSNFGNEDFDDKRLGEIAKEYIATLEDGLAALRYYTVDNLQYSNKWDEARVSRTHLLEELVSDFDFAVDEAYADILENLVSDSEVYSEQEQLKATIQNVADNAILSTNPYIDDYSGETLWYDYSITFTNTTDVTLEYFFVDIQVVDGSGNIFAQGSCDSIQNFQSGQSATVDAYIFDNEYDISGYDIQFIPHYSASTLYA